MQLAKLGTRPKRPDNLVPVRHRKVGAAVLLTTHFGDWVFVSEQEFAGLMQGQLESGSELERRLRDKGFLVDSLDSNALAQRLRHKKSFLRYGPNPVSYTHLTLPTSDLV